MRKVTPSQNVTAAAPLKVTESRVRARRHVIAPRNRRALKVSMSDDDDGRDRGASETSARAVVAARHVSVAQQLQMTMT